MQEMNKDDDTSRGTAEDLLEKLNKTLSDLGAEVPESDTASDFDDIFGKKSSNEPADDDLPDGFLSDFLEREISDVELPDDIVDDGYVSNSEDDDFVSCMLDGDMSYVADHSDDGGRTRIAGAEDPNDIDKDGDVDAIDRNLMLTFGQEEELAEKIGADVVNEISENIESDGEYYEDFSNILSVKDKAAEEYNSPTQNDDIVKSYKKAYKLESIKLIGVSLLLALSLVIENISKLGIELPEIFRPAVYPVVYVMIELQILLIAAAIVYRSVFRGLFALIKGKPAPESLVSVTVLLSAVYAIFTAAVFPAMAGAVYMFPLILGIWVLQLCNFFVVKREMMSFAIVSTKSPKFALSKLNIESSALETETFFEFLPDKPSIYKISKPGFIGNYFRRSSGSIKSKAAMGIAVPAAFVLSIAFFFIGMITKGGAEHGIGAAYTTLMLCSPVSLLLAFGFPIFRAACDAFSDDGAIVGERAVDEYADATVVSFDDREVFPAYSVKVKSVKIYGKNRIDRVIYNTASVFNVLGGPLADVFDVATVELGKSDNVEIIKIEPDGTEALVDGVRVCVGKASFISRLSLTPYYDMEDDQAENNGDISIMYVVCGENVAAKMYVQYISDPDFEILLEQLRKTGVCVGIKTLDPNIDDRLLSAKTDLVKYPVRIIRARNVEDMDAKEEVTDSGIVSKKSAKSLLRLVALCDKTKNAIKTNVVIGIFSLGIGLLISAFLLLTDMNGIVPSFLIGLYHIFWTLPMILTSKSV